MGRMDIDVLALSDASDLLGVSPERVRQLVVAGDLPGVRLGNVWVVPRAAVVSRQRRSSRPGRPLSARRVWEAIRASDGDFCNAARYRNRGNVRRFEMSRADADYLSRHEKALVSGVAAAIGYGEGLPDEDNRVHIYLPESVAQQLSSSWRRPSATTGFWSAVRWSCCTRSSVAQSTPGRPSTSTSWSI